MNQSMQSYGRTKQDYPDFCMSIPKQNSSNEQEQQGNQACNCHGLTVTQVVHDTRKHYSTRDYVTLSVANVLCWSVDMNQYGVSI
jgi:hypothetical protein